MIESKIAAAMHDANQVSRDEGEKHKSRLGAAAAPECWCSANKKRSESNAPRNIVG
jgi:hypothetical protein